jgi:uncharacterized protein YceK
MKNFIVTLSTLLLLSSCSSNHKKIIVYLKGNGTVNAEAKTITASEGSGSDEKIIFYKTTDKVDLKVVGLGNEGTVSIDQDGLYVLNAKTDTIIGSYQKYSDPRLSQTMKTQEDLKHDIDSLKQLTEGKNISATNRNFYLLPKTAVKISDNLDAFVVGPFHRMTSIEKVDGKLPEVYRFYSIQEVRETIEKLTALTKAK